jgi:hypothetical protein
MEQPIASAAPEGSSAVESGLNPTAQDALNAIDDFRAQEEALAAQEVCVQSGWINKGDGPVQLVQNACCMCCLWFVPQPEVVIPIPRLDDMCVQVIADNYQGTC